MTQCLYNKKFVRFFVFPTFVIADLTKKDSDFHTEITPKKLENEFFMTYQNDLMHLKIGIWRPVVERFRNLKH